MEKQIGNIHVSRGFDRTGHSVKKNRLMHCKTMECKILECNYSHSFTCVLLSSILNAVSTSAG